MAFLLFLLCKCVSDSVCECVLHSCHIENNFYLIYFIQCSLDIFIFDSFSKLSTPYSHPQMYKIRMICTIFFRKVMLVTMGLIHQKSYKRDKFFKKTYIVFVFIVY